MRYFEPEAEEAAQPKPTRFVCKNCGAEGDHKTYECPVQVVSSLASFCVMLFIPLEVSDMWRS